MQPLAPKPESVTKKRARRACSPCRRRKVRCMRPHLPRPNIHCESHTEGLELWKAISSYDCNTSDRNDGTSTIVQVQNSWSNSNGIDSSEEKTPMQQQSQGCDNIGNEDAITGNIVVSLSALESKTSYATTEPSQVIPFPGPQYKDEDGVSTSTEEQRPIHGTMNNDYAFLQIPEIHVLSQDDLRFLNQHGCFVAPKRSVLDEFVRQYFRHVHPMLPIFDEGDFWDLYKSRSGDEKRLANLKTPMIVLQAMLFATCSYVPEEAIKELGFPTIVKAKLAFYNRTKLLYDLECESSPLAIAQATLLLSCCHLTPLPPVRCKVSGPLWLSIAVRHARDAGAHRYHLISGEDLAGPAGRTQLHNRLKRLWWCCIINDRTMALAFRQNLNITRSCFDFDHAPPLTTADLIVESSHSEVYTADIKLCHAEIVVQLAALCTIMTDVLAMTSALHNSALWNMRQSVAALHRCSAFKLKLEVWYSSFSKIKSIITRDISQASSSTTSIILFTNLIELYYYSLMFNLGNYKLLQLAITTSLLSSKYNIIVEPEMIDDQRNALRYINECLRTLNSENALTLLPISAIGCIAIALTLKMLEVDLLQLRNVDEGASKDSASFSQSEQLDTLTKVMDIYRPRYYTVDWIEKTVLYAVSLSRRWLHTCMQRDTEDTSIVNWADILRSKPLDYLHLAMTVDLSIGHGRLPDESEFPVTLRNLPHDHTCSFNPNYHNFGTCPSLTAESRASETSIKSRVISADMRTHQDPSQEKEEPSIDETRSVVIVGAHSTSQSMPDFVPSHNYTPGGFWSLPSLKRPTQLPSSRDSISVYENTVMDAISMETPWSPELPEPIDFHNKNSSTDAIIDDIFIESLFEAEAALFLPRVEH